MKINTFTAILACALAGIIAFFLTFYVSADNKEILGFGSFFAFALTLIGTLSISFEYDRTTALTRIASGFFVGLVLISQIVFTSFENFFLPTYVLVTGSLVIFFVLVIYALSQSKH